MPAYHIRYLNAFTGAVISSRQIIAQTDAEAIACGEEARRLAPMELWLGERRIKCWEAFPPVT